MRKEFSQRTKLQAWERAIGRCEVCGHKIKAGERRVFDHVLPDALSGLNDLENCQVLCGPCDKDKTASDVGQIRKADRQKASYIGAKTRKGTPMPGTKASRHKKLVTGEVMDRQTGEIVWPRQEVR